MKVKKKKTNFESDEKIDIIETPIEPIPLIEKEKDKVNHERGISGPGCRCF